MALSAVAAIAFLTSAYKKLETSAHLKDGKLSSQKQEAPARPTSLSADEQKNFLQNLPSAAQLDPQFRQASTLAQSQHVTLLQLKQDAPSQPDKRHLPQAHVTLQLRGDYRDIKAVTAGLLEKFPGLVLQHMTVRHHGDNAPAAQAAAAAPADDLADDQATLELTQYLRPLQAS